ncbi:MAG TPA: helix-turn-helix transcriptional regulator [Terriglobales bacterium]|nr:helix-turn-helix transcriptional regulator [Terriglobales bacterium]
MENLKKIRVRQGLTQRQIAEATGISQSLLSKYENGDRTPTCGNLIALARFLDTSTDYLLGLTPERTPYPKI